MKINEIIKQIRLNLNLSQTTFAERIGVSFSTVNRWENEKAAPNRLAIRAIKTLAEESNIEKDLAELIKRM